MPTLTSRWSFALAAAVALLGSGCDIQVGDNGVSVDLAQGRMRDEWRRTYTISPGGRLEIVNQTGRIEVEPASGPIVELLVERSVQGGSDEESRAILDQLQMTEEVSPARVKVEMKPPNETEGRLFSRRGVLLRYRVRVPEGLTVVLRNGDGPIRLGDVKGRFEAATTNGGITAEDISGSIKATSVNGGVQIEMAAVAGDIEAAATNGGVRVRLPRGTKATLDATSVNGGVSVDDDLGLQAAETSRERVSGTLNGGGSKIVASTVNGGVRINAGDSPDAREPDRRSRRSD
jgi:hypothetical protein